MHFSLPVLAVLCSSINLTLSSVVPSTNQLLDRGTTLESPANPGLKERNGAWTCTPENVHVRNEWRALSKDERKEYTDAVLCLRKKPSLYKEVTGSKSHYDDFQVVHINQSFIIHFNAQFMPWHRWFTWTYEQALKRECGYKGFQPYWDWTLDTKDVDASPLFDGSPYSMSGNGLYIPGRPNITVTINLPPNTIPQSILPPGTGGGCVTTGPFANIQVPFGELGLSINGSFVKNPKNLDYTPHCLRRDLNSKLIAPSLTRANVDILLGSPNITAFNAVLNQGTDPNVLSLHGGGHLGISKDMGDIITSPGDPIFFLHHAQLDRLWTLWQKRNLTERQYAISGTATFLNYPPSPEFRLNDTIDLGKLSPRGPQPIRDFMNTLDGPFCYEYA